MSDLILGPFLLQHRVGRGGMSDVWQATHVHDDVRVAVKVLTAERARQPHNLRMFRTEIRAVARLDHPHVVGVHDAGVVPAEVAARSDGLLQAGMPYLVMDLLGGGSLWAYRGRLPWPDLKGLLLRLLDALAHAHARGVVHRDLKLTNILLTLPDRRAVITDFGLAQLRRDDAAVHLPAGTPAYMAPEQFLDEWRDFGPWTDLYGFGCLAWALATGAAPYAQEDWTVVRDAHLAGHLPPFLPAMAVPSGFEAWLRELLEPDLTRRTQRAADAAWALDRLADPERGRHPSAGRLPTLSEASTLTFGAPTSVGVFALGAEGRADRPPPPPAQWHGLPSRPRLQLRGTGLGVYSARPTPIVGRITERDMLWRQVLALHSDPPCARVVWLEGAAGTGKTHLARWLAERAHELGAAHVWWCEHPVAGGSGQGLAGAVRAHLHADGLADDALHDRVTRACRSWGLADPDDAAQIVALLTATEASAEARVAVGRLALHVAAPRPLIVVVDDAQRGLDALLFARRLVEAAPARVLIVGCLRDQALGPAIADVVGALTPRAERLRIDPLPAADHEAMVRELLGIEVELARRVAERTQGNPAFAAALVADWIARDQLVRGPGGFRLRPDADDAFPDDLFAFWCADLDRALAGQPAKAREAIELAAVLGQHVDTLRWRRIAARAGLLASLEAVDALIVHRLAESGRPSVAWRFVHPMVREALLRVSEESGRRPALHRWVLEDLERAASIDPEEHARHLLGAGRRSEAVGRLVIAARNLGHRGHPHGVLDLLDQAEQALLADPSLAPRWRRDLDVGHVSAYVLLGRYDEALAAAGRVLPAFDDAPDHPDRAFVQTLEARVLLLRGDTRTARNLLQDVVARLQPDDLPPTHSERLADALRTLGLVHLIDGDLRRAERVLRDSLRWAQDAQAGPMWCESSGFLATVLSQLGRHDDAEALLANAIASPHASARALRASLLNIRAELLNARGRPREAEPYYRQAVALLEQVGSLEAVVPRLNLSILAALDARYDEAWSLAERCAHEGHVQGRPPLLFAVRAVLTVAAIGLQNPTAAVEQAHLVLELAAAGVTTEPAVYRLLDTAAKLLRPDDPPLGDALARAARGPEPDPPTES